MAQAVLTPGQTIPFTVGSQTFETWYTTTSLDTSRSGRPLVALHGGPGSTHHYLLPLAELAKRHNIQVIFYDQIGNGLSSHVPDAPPSFWEPNLFMDELENLLKHLKIEDDFDLYGQSWGGMLASQFAAERQPKGLKRLIISGSFCSMDHFVRASRKNLEGLPQDIKETIKRHDEAGTIDSPEFQVAHGNYLKKHVCRLDELPDELKTAFGWMIRDPTVNKAMLGTKKFTVTGSLKDWNIISKLNRISPSISTLLINGRYDAADTEGLMPFFKHLTKVKWVTLDTTSHTPIWEEKERYLEIIGDFLAEA